MEYDSQTVEYQDFSSSITVGQIPDKLVLVTYNIRYGVGPWLITGGLLRRFGIQLSQPRERYVRQNIERVSHALAGQYGFPRAHIVALQESDRNTKRCGNSHISQEIARALGYHLAFAPSHLPRNIPPEVKQWYLDFEEIIKPDDTGDTGLAFLSQLPFSAKRLELPVQGCPWRPRLALTGTWELPGLSLTVINSHIDPHAKLEGQLAQHERILAEAKKTPNNCILLGDFNTLTSNSRTETRRFLEREGFTSPISNGTATWRAGLLSNHTDWIFTRGVQVLRWGVARNLRHASDHWPVWIEISGAAS